ncbi:MAG: putative LPS assembly protein LptD, partial [Rhodothermales bacterium]|nr:putative LPS assembly protein LptD [Rhodothermales bacterium]
STSYRSTASPAIVVIAAGLLALLPVARIIGQETASPPSEGEAPAEEIQQEIPPLPQIPEADSVAEDAAESDEDVAEEIEEEKPSPQPKTSFTIPIPAEEGGGVAVGKAGQIEYLREDLVVATGGANIKYQDMKFQADRITVDLKTNVLVADGNVILDEGPRRLAGTSMVFDLDTKTGTVKEADAFLERDIYFKGEEVEKTGEDTYVVKHGMMTSCEAEVPQWSFRMGKAHITVDGYARIHNTSMRVKKMPVLYFPYMLWPAKTDRSSGFLVPNIGYSSEKGGLLHLAYFQTMGDSYDATLYADIYESEYYGLGTEFRYRPSVDTEGIFDGYAIEDPIGDETRWKVNWEHDSKNLPLGLRGVIKYNDFSDFEFFRDFERDFNRSTIRRLQSAGFLAGSWGLQSFTLRVDQSETFLSNGGTVTQRQLPEAEYRLRPTQLGGWPLYLELLSSLHYFSIERTDVIDDEGTETAVKAEYGRADLFPQLSLPFRPWPWLSTSFNVGGRATWYTDSLNQTRTELSGESLTRFFPTAEARIIGPSFSRIFEKGIGSFAKFKHIIEPRFGYAYIGDFDEQRFVPRFDEVDILKPTHVYGVSLVNRLLAKPEDEEEMGGAREIFSFELTRIYSLDKDTPLQQSRDKLTTSRSGPITAQLRYNPSPRTRWEAKASYNTLFSGLNSASLSGGLAFGSTDIMLTWYARFNAELEKTTSHQVRLYTGFDLWRDRLRLESQINYDAERDLLQQQRHYLTYTGSCYGLRLELRQYESLTRKDQDYRFAISLKNVGTFLDLTGGTTTKQF